MLTSWLPTVYTEGENWCRVAYITCTQSIVTDYYTHIPKCNILSTLQDNKFRIKNKIVKVTSGVNNYNSWFLFYLWLWQRQNVHDLNKFLKYRLSFFFNEHVE